MKAEITFDDVEKKYRYVAEHIDFCRGMALNEEFPAHATWLDSQTLARWFDEAIGEFAEEYSRVFKRYFEENTRKLAVGHEECLVQAVVWQSDITNKRLELRYDIMMKYPIAFSATKTEALSQ